MAPYGLAGNRCRFFLDTIMYRADGGCHCGNIKVDVELAAAPETYHPRVCDCDFFRKHGAA